MKSRSWLLARAAAAQPEICQLVVAELCTELRESMLNVLSNAGSLSHELHEQHAASAELRRACGLLGHMLLASAQTSCAVTAMLRVLVPELGQVLARLLARATLSALLAQLRGGGEAEAPGQAPAGRRCEPVRVTSAGTERQDEAAHMRAAREVLAPTPLSSLLPACS
jgi:hypothetical protein